MDLTGNVSQSPREGQCSVQNENKESFLDVILPGIIQEIPEQFHSCDLSVSILKVNSSLA
jgi:hypothetical protein